MSEGEQFRDDSISETPVRGFLHRAEGEDALVLTHGAGANCQSPLLRALAAAFWGAGLTVLRCDLPFRQKRPHGPPMRGSAERDQEGLKAAVSAMRRIYKGMVLLGGHSYGGRQASMLAAAGPDVTEGLLLLSYPLHPPQKPDQLRTAHFPSLKTPAMFISGERDGFGTRNELETALREVPVRTSLMMVPGAGHELITPKNRTELPESVAKAFLDFVKVS
jgi:predicted alpha/beta-hydrolase family hydrolase